VLEVPEGYDSIAEVTRHSLVRQSRQYGPYFVGGLVFLVALLGLATLDKALIVSVGEPVVGANFHLDLLLVEICRFCLKVKQQNLDILARNGFRDEADGELLIRPQI